MAGEGDVRPETALRPLFLPYRFAAGDFRSNGRIDIAHALGAWPIYSISLRLQGSDGTYRQKVPLGGGRLTSVEEVHAADLDGDGLNDLLTFTGSSRELIVRRGRGGGRFDPAVAHNLGYTVGHAFGDIDGDGRTDIVLHEANGGVSYRAGRGSPTGTDLAVFTGLNASAAAVRVENRGTMHAAAYQLTFRLDVRIGSANAGTIPGDCTAQAWGGLHPVHLPDAGPRAGRPSRAPLPVRGRRARQAQLSHWQSKSGLPLSRAPHGQQRRE